MSVPSGEDPTATERNKALVWSGLGNYEQAERACREDGKQRLESTEAGRGLIIRNDNGPARSGIALGHQERLTRDYANKFRKLGLSPEEIEVRSKKAAIRIAQREWNDASRLYSANASGNVDTYVVGAEQNRTFRRYELPELLRNEKVTSINGIDRDELAKLERTEAFDHICRAELDRDRKRVAVGGLKVDDRQKTYDDWRGQQYGQDKVLEAALVERGDRRSTDDRGPGLKHAPSKERLTPRASGAGPRDQDRGRSPSSRQRR